MPARPPERALPGSASQGSGTGIFLRGLGCVYLVAFASLWTQVLGLMGQRGILPAAGYLQLARQQIGLDAYRLVPTLCWFNTSDAFLQFLCGGGAALSLLLIFGIAPALILFLLWAFYLSLSSVSQEFLNFQWDALLLETGFLAIFLAPLQLRLKAGTQPPPSRVILWLLRWLLFRLMFSSGAVKLISGDPAWRNFTALTVHYETQPLPTWIGWAMHQLPVWFHSFSCGVMFAIELLVPFSIFGPKRIRHIGCAILIAFQVLILVTGNYCFFNWLTILLCLLLLGAAEQGIKTTRGRWPIWIIGPVAAGVILASTAEMIGTLHLPMRWPKPVAQMMDFLIPFRSVNSYGLFAVMTTSRPEIVVEGSEDGANWLPYEFKYKPGDLKRRPDFVAPHQPRLDWQMWFASLGSYQGNPWFLNFCMRLLQGSPEVLALLKENPFPQKPPRYIRASLYDYRFTDLHTLRSEGTWWRRMPKGFYCPVLSYGCTKQPSHGSGSSLETKISCRGLPATSRKPTAPCSTRKMA